ncbi:MAG: DUF503 domain-containing protein [Candidatus Caldatribacteriota bacterium]|nr:DUF503 domain-containing protein [Candidatus Caldatribacteriota bacterium]
MIVGTATIKLYAPWVHSLKEKRMIVKSIIAKTKNKFNVSIAEVGEQDKHQTIILGIACVTDTFGLSDSIVNNVITFVENNTETEIMYIQREMR